MLARGGPRHQGPRALRWSRSLWYIAPVQRLLAFLRDNIFLDFQGDLDLARVRELLAGDDSPTARKLLAHLTKDGGTEGFLVAIADCLLEPVQAALTDEVLREQVHTYVES
jgi:hypothetical protein